VPEAGKLLKPPDVSGVTRLRSAVTVKMFLPAAAVKVVNTIFVPPANKRVEGASGGRVDDRAPQAGWPCTWVWRSSLLSVCTPRSVVRLSPAMRRTSTVWLLRGDR
jgi:hypothetical protein